MNRFEIRQSVFFLALVVLSLAMYYVQIKQLLQKSICLPLTLEPLMRFQWHLGAYPSRLDSLVRASRQTRRVRHRSWLVIWRYQPSSSPSVPSLRLQALGCSCRWYLSPFQQLECSLLWADATRSTGGRTATVAGRGARPFCSRAAIPRMSQSRAPPCSKMGRARV